MRQNRTVVTWFQFYPTQADADARRLHTGLRSLYDPDFVQFMRKQNRLIKNRTAYAGQTVIWADDAKIWIVTPEGWDRVKAAITAVTGFSLRAVACPAMVKTFQPQQRQDAREVSLPEALRWLRGHGHSLTIDPRRQTLLCNGEPTQPVLTVIRQYRDVLVWLLSGSGEASKTSAQRLQQENPHAVLGVLPGTSAEAIERAYRALVKTVHPDRIPLDMDAELRQLAETKALRINLAYDALRVKA